METQPIVESAGTLPQSQRIDTLQLGNLILAQVQQSMDLDKLSKYVR